jgi:hypothetical protein
MSDATIIAAIILVGVFAVMSITIVTRGISAAIQLWGVMGAITGVAVGAITSYYFTKQTTSSQVATLVSENARFELLLASATMDAAEARKLVDPVYAMLNGENSRTTKSEMRSGDAGNLSSEERTSALASLAKARFKLDSIQARDSSEGALASASVMAGTPVAAPSGAAPPEPAPPAAPARPPQP